jgi:hypothetical protein
MYCRKVSLKKGYVWECSEEIPKDPVTGKKKKSIRSRKDKTGGKSKVRAKNTRNNRIRINYGSITKQNHL